MNVNKKIHTHTYLHTYIYTYIHIQIKRHFLAFFKFTNAIFIDKLTNLTPNRDSYYKYRTLMK